MTAGAETVTRVGCLVDMRIRLVMLALTVATTAHASRARPDVMIAKGGRVTYHKLSPIDDDHAKLRIVLATRSTEMREVSVPITIPKRFVVTGLLLSMAETEPVVARTLERIAAGDEYRATVEQVKDPAIVEWIDAHHVRVRVFPVTRYAAATVTLQLAVVAPAVAHVTPTISLLALPPWVEPREGPIEDARYASYWPSHTSGVPVPNAEADL